MKQKLTTFLVAASLLLQNMACIAVEKPQNTFSNKAGGVSVKGRLSQTKVLQGSDGLIYLQVDMDSENTMRVSRKPTDFVIVLDRSGSMADQKKMDYAHRAIDSLINQLQPMDRLSLVAFDSMIETPISMTYASSANKTRFRQILKGILPRGGTNLGGGLIEGIAQIRESRRDRAQRMILLSDGLANEGIVDENQLRRIAAESARDSFSISTIGVGLEFNEHLMAGVADYGHGSYYYLEKLAMLDKVLSDEFQRASQINASDVRVTLNLNESIQVTDASGYPFHQEGNRVIVEPGHLYSGQKKSFFITLQVPTHSVFMKPLGNVDVSFKAQDQTYQVSLLGSDVTIACLPAERKEDVARSIDKGVYEKAWTENNYGRFLKESATKVSQGNQAGAMQDIQDYRDKLQEAYQAAPTPAMKEKLDSLKPQEAEVRSAFSAPNSEEATKRLGKDYQYKGIQQQRSVQ